MATYKYIVTVQEPSQFAPSDDGLRAIEIKPEPIRHEFVTGQAAAHAIEYARAQHTRPDGTVVTIQRRKLTPDLVDSRPVVVETGPWLVPYRRYEVRGGVVRRVNTK